MAPSRPASSSSALRSRWIELSTFAEPEAVDEVAELFQRWGQGVAIEPPIVSAPEGDSYCVDPSRPVVVKTYLRLDSTTEERLGRLEQGVWHLGQLRHVAPLRQRELAEEDWAHAWKRHFFVHRIGQRLVVVPTWRRYRARAEDVVLRLDPGMAFGTGLHPTTRLCLQALERWLRPGSSVLDLGTGSGILALAAARLGARRVLALDVDPLAVRVASENVRRNRLVRRVQVAHGSLPLAAPQEPFELVVANINRAVILGLMGGLCLAVAPGGLAVLSGLLAQAREEVSQAAEREGLQVLEISQEGDWIALIARRGSGGAETLRPRD